MKHPELLLSNQICFLVYRLNRAIQARYRPLLEEIGLTYPQYLAMLALWEHGELTIGELCKLLDLDTGTVSPLVKRLEKNGLLKKQRSPTDERSVSIRLTEKGRALQEKALPVPGALASCIPAGRDEFKDLKNHFLYLIDLVEKKGSC